VRVGAVIPVGGAAPFLPEALGSVLAETPDEVVVVDDGADGLDVPEPVRVVSNDGPRGAGGARNAGVAALSPGIDVVAFCDADDAWTPGSLARRLLALDAHPQAAGVFGSARIVGADGRETGERWDAAAPGPLQDAKALYAANPVLTSSVVLRRDACLGFDTDFPLAEDWDLWLRLLRAGRPLVSVPRAEVRYRRHAGGLTHDIIALAAAQRRLHARHGDLVGPATRARTLARDLTTELGARARRALGRGRTPYRR
jgi:glycosyltransferase involved in cell wall biosynthesis